MLVFPSTHFFFLSRCCVRNGNLTDVHVPHSINRHKHANTIVYNYIAV